jgi:hypothetical protein
MPEKNSTRKRRLVRVTGLIVGALALAGTLTSCSADTYASQCAYVIGNGAGDNHELKDIIYPNTKVTTGDDDVKLVPCNARNFIVTDKADVGDRHDPAVGKTKAGEDGFPATSMNVYISGFWSLNQSKEALTAFLPVCEKYNCFQGVDDADNANFSSTGWTGMLNENFSFALDKSVARAMLDFEPGIWQDQSQWPTLADTVSKYFAEEVRNRLGAKVDFFCGNAGAGEGGSQGGTCSPVRFSVDKVTPSDSAVVDVYNRTIVAQSEATAARADEVSNTAQLAAARARYGSMAEYYLGELDVIKACSDAKATCVVGTGGAPSISIPQAVPAE